MGSGAKLGMKILTNLVAERPEWVPANDDTPGVTLPETAYQVIAYPEELSLEDGQLVKLFGSSLSRIARRWVQVPQSGLCPDQGYLKLEVRRSDGSFGLLYEIGCGGGEFHTASGAHLYARACGGPVKLIAAEERY